MLEAYIEAKVCAYARAQYGFVNYKQGGHGYRNRPDRLFLGPRGRMFFIEFKQTGKKPTAGQERELQKLRVLGFKADWCDSIEQGKRIVDENANRLRTPRSIRLVSTRSHSHHARSHAPG
jgi:hypothetical protein